MQAWIWYVLIGALLQVGWLQATERFSFPRLKLVFSKRTTWGMRWQGLWPAIGYLVFGIGNVAMLGKAMQTMSAAVVYAGWTGVVMVLAAVLDHVRMQKRPMFRTLFFLGCILAGTMILQWSSR